MASLGEQRIEQRDRVAADAGGALHDLGIAMGAVMHGHVRGVGDEALACSHAPMQGNALLAQQHLDKIGRASCRERVCQYVSISVVAVSFTKKSNTLQSA